MHDTTAGQFTGAIPERLIEALSDAFIHELDLRERPLQMQAIVFEAA